MKKLLILPLLIISFWSTGQYDPSKATVTNKPLGIAQAVPTDARSYYYSPSLFIWRPYQSTAEVLSTLNIAKYRIGHFPIYVNVGGTLLSGGTFSGGSITEYWFKNGVADSNLVVKNEAVDNTGTVAQLRAMSTVSGKVYISTDMGGGTWVDVGPYDGDVTDDGATYIVTTNNRKLKRQVTGAIHAKWFANPTDTLDDLSGLNAAVTATPSGGTLIIDAGNFYLSNSLTINKPIVLQGEGSAFNFTSQITPTANFPANNPLINSTTVLGRTNIYDIASDMKFKGGDFIFCNGNSSSNNILRNHARHVTAGNWGVHFGLSSNPNGSALNNINYNGFYDLAGGGIFIESGGDSNSFMDNWFQMVNGTHVLLYNGVVGSARFKFTGNNGTGGSKGIEINGALEPYVALNQFEATVPITNAQHALLMIGNTVVANDVFGMTIENNNLNCSSGSGHANVAIYLGDVQDAHLNNNTIFGSDTALKLGSLARRIIFSKGYTEGVVYDPLGEATIRSGGSTNLFQSDIQLTGKNSTGIKYGFDANQTSILNVDPSDLNTTADAYFRLFRKTSTTGNKSLDMFVGNGTTLLQHSLNAATNSFLQAFSGGLMVGSNNTPDANAVLQLSGNQKGFLTTRMYRGSIEAIPNTNGLLTYDLTTNKPIWNDGGQIRVIEDSTVLIHKGLEEIIPAKKTFQGNTPIIVSSTTGAGGNIQFKNTGNTLGWYTGITGDTTGNYLVYNGTTSQPSVSISKTTDHVSYHGTVSGANAVSSGDFITKSQFDSYTPPVVPETDPYSIPKGDLSARSIADANTANANDFFFAGGSNRPSGTIDGALMNLQYNSSYQSQLFLDWRTGRVYSRGKGGSSFTTWAGMVNDAMMTDTLNAREAANTFILRNAGGTGDSLMSNPYTNMAIMKKLRWVGATSATTDTTITVTVNAPLNGTVSFTGNGSSTSFTIPLSVAGMSASSKIFLTAKTAIGAALNWVDVSDESITVYYLTAPTSGVKTLNYMIIP